MKKYVLKSKDKTDRYLLSVDFWIEFTTSNVRDAKIFYSKKDAEIFNKNYLGDKYEIIELETISKGE